MSWNGIPRAGLRLAILVPLLAITPLTFGPREGVEENRACGQSRVCFPRIGDMCYFDGNLVEDYYTKYVY